MLLVEDEAAVRALHAVILQAAGYTVLREAATATRPLGSPEATRADRPALTDVVMPGMSGPELAERQLARWPDMRVLFMSGYTDDAIVHHGVLDAGIAFLQKPFTPGSAAEEGARGARADRAVADPSGLPARIQRRQSRGGEGRESAWVRSR